MVLWSVTTNILNDAQALRFQAQLPITYWSDCILTAVHLINILLTSKLNNKNPCELLFLSKPSYSQLKVLGCLYVSTLSKHCSNLILEHDCVFLVDIHIRRR